MHLRKESEEERNELKTLLRRWLSRECPKCGSPGAPTGAVRICNRHGQYWDLNYVASIKSTLVRMGVFPLDLEELTNLILFLHIYMDLLKRGLGDIKLGDDEEEEEEPSPPSNSSPLEEQGALPHDQSGEGEESPNEE